jgi:hypothetical protein
MLPVEVNDGRTIDGPVIGQVQPKKDGGNAVQAQSPVLGDALTFETVTVRLGIQRAQRSPNSGSAMRYRGTPTPPNYWTTGISMTKLTPTKFSVSFVSAQGS